MVIGGLVVWSRESTSSWQATRQAFADLKVERPVQLDVYEIVYLATCATVPAVCAALLLLAVLRCWLRTSADKKGVVACATLLGEHVACSILMCPFSFALQTRCEFLTWQSV